MQLISIFWAVISLSLLLFAWADDNSPCSPGKGSKLLYRKDVYRRALKGLAQDVYVTYPETSNTELVKPDVEIVDFCVTDHNPNLYGAKGVFAHVEGEDLDRKLAKATIILRGQESRGINSTVEFYGFKV